MSKKLSVILIVLLAVIILGLAFYWYEYRPARIYGKCNEQASENARKIADRPDQTYFITQYDGYYKICLRENGLDK